MYKFIYTHIFSICIHVGVSQLLVLLIFTHVGISEQLASYISINRRSACGKVPHVALVRWNYFDECVCGSSTGARDPSAKMEDFDLMLERFKMVPNNYPKLSLWSQQGAKMSQWIFNKKKTAEQERKR